jgi:hypothetical protein
MPFVLMPMLWSRISRAGRRTAVAGDRAHGDGMSISLDSPEAFEEIVWLAWLRDRFVRERCLEPLTTASPEFAESLRFTIRKLLADSRPGNRYLSKNNANISRLELLSELYPTSTILVVFRDPRAQVESLHRQHLRFSAIHAREPFARQYMQWIGHFEFGTNLRPINFSGWLEGAGAGLDATDREFWLRYWTAAYRYAIERRTRNVSFVDFDQLLRSGRDYLARLADVAGLRIPSRLEAQADILRVPGCVPRGATEYSRAGWHEAARLHDELRHAAAGNGQSLALTG